MSGPIRILIADDHAIVREGLRALIGTEPGLELVAEAADGVEAVNKARDCNPDVILLDMMMPRKDGLGAITDIMQENPDARILVLTSFAEDDKVFPAIKAGALGYLLKDSNPPGTHTSYPKCLPRRSFFTSRDCTQADAGVKPACESAAHHRSADGARSGSAATRRPGSLER